MRGIIRGRMLRGKNWVLIWRNEWVRIRISMEERGRGVV